MAQATIGFIGVGSMGSPVAANLLRNSTHEPGVLGALTRVTKDTNELVRTMAARALDGPGRGH